MNAALVALVALSVVGIQVLDRAEASVEGSVRRYAAAVTNSDLEGALAEIAPDQRAMILGASSWTFKKVA